MESVEAQRLTAAHQGPLVVFLIGMRVNRWWKVHRWWPVAAAMPRMLKELSERPDSGFLGAQPAGFAQMVQYWRSREQLMAYARDKSGQHFPAWADFNRRLKGSADVGIWHEIYAVEPGAYHSLYYAMPPRGLGKFTGLEDVRGHAPPGTKLQRAS